MEDGKLVEGGETTTGVTILLDVTEVWLLVVGAMLSKEVETVVGRDVTGVAGSVTVALEPLMTKTDVDVEVVSGCGVINTVVAGMVELGVGAETDAQ